MYHSNHEGIVGRFWKVADQAMVVATIGLNALTFPTLNYMRKGIMCTQGLIVFHLYVNGKRQERFCHSKDRDVGFKWHSVVHLAVCMNAHLALI